MNLVKIAAPVALLLAQSLAAPCSENPQQPTPTFSANARAVVVDVVVTKGDGDAVTALRKDDFQVLENGQPQTIDYFEEHQARELAPGAIAPLPAMPPNVYTNVPPVPESDAVNVLLLDSLNTEKQDQIYVHKQILNFLRNMKPGTRAAIFTLGSRLRFIQGFTTDSSQLVAALNDKKNGFVAQLDASSRSRSDSADDAQDIQTLASMLGGSGRTDAGIQALAQSQSEYGEFQLGNRIKMTLEALDYLARFLAAVPGRKNLIWFASSFPVTIYPSALQDQSLSNIRVYTDRVKSTADLLTLSKVAVYPVSAQGVMVEHTMEADQAGPSRMGGIGAYGDAANARADTIMAMEQLASDTGGKAYYNTNDLNTAVQHAIADGSHYYTLVYTPANKKLDGKYRRIEVKVPSGRYHLSYRHGYNADTGQAARPDVDSNPLRPLLRFGLPAETEVLYGVRVLPADPQPATGSVRAGKNPKLSGPVTRYNLDFLIDLKDVKLVATADGEHRGTLEVGLIAYDGKGNAVNWTGATQQMNLKPDLYAAIERSGIPAHVEIDLPTTPVLLVTGIYDWNSGKAGTLSIPLPAPAVKAPAAAGK